MLKSFTVGGRLAPAETEFRAPWKRNHAELGPGRFIDITNGVTPRRWLMQAKHAGQAAWAENALRDIAGMGAFSIDRTIRASIEQVRRAAARQPSDGAH